jgi:hypothetical protein
MKRLLCLVLVAAFFLTGCMGGGGAMRLDRVWEDRYLDFILEYTEYHVQRLYFPEHDCRNVSECECPSVPIAEGIFWQEIKPLTENGRNYQVFTSELKITYLDDLSMLYDGEGNFKPDLTFIMREPVAGAMDTITTTLKFGADDRYNSHATLTPFRMEKVMDFQSVPQFEDNNGNPVIFSRTIIAEYSSDGFTLTQTLHGDEDDIEEPEITARARAVRGMFDNEALFLVARAMPAFTPGGQVSIPIVSAVDTGIHGKLTTFNLTASVEGGDPAPLRISSDNPELITNPLLSDFANKFDYLVKSGEDGDYLEAHRALFTSQGSPRGPAIEVFFSAVPIEDRNNRNSSAEQVFLKIIQTESYLLTGDNQYRPALQTVFTIKDFSTI